MACLSAGRCRCFSPAGQAAFCCLSGAVFRPRCRRGPDGLASTLSEVSLNGRPLSSGAYWSFYTDEEELPEAFVPGREVSFRGSLYHPEGASNPDGYDFREELLRRGITVGLYGDEDLSFSAPSVFSFAGVTASWRARLSAALVREMGDEAGGYTSALLLGTRSLIPSEDRAAFSKLGIAHVLSVSGFHTGILVMLLAALFRLLKLRQSVRLVLYAVVLLAYCALCGFNPPVVRASLLLLLALGGKILNRPRRGLHLLCASAILLLLLSPVQLTGISFQLTFAALLGITLISPYLDSLNPFRWNWRRRILSRLWSSVSFVLGAELGVLVPVLYYYQKLPLLSLLVNLPVSYFVTVLLSLDWIVLLLLPVPFLCGLPAAAARVLTSWLVSGVRALSALPGITLWTHASTWVTVLGMLAVFVALCRLFRSKPWVRILCLLSGLAVVCVSLLPPPHRETEYIQFGVGNADAADLDAVRIDDRESAAELNDLSGMLHGDTLQLSAFNCEVLYSLAGHFQRHRGIGLVLGNLHTGQQRALHSVEQDDIPVHIHYGDDHGDVNLFRLVHGRLDHNLCNVEKFAVCDCGFIRERSSAKRQKHQTCKHH